MGVSVFFVIPLYLGLYSPLLHPVDCVRGSCPVFHLKSEGIGTSLVPGGRSLLLYLVFYMFVVWCVGWGVCGIDFLLLHFLFTTCGPGEDVLFI